MSEFQELREKFKEVFKENDRRALERHVEHLSLEELAKAERTFREKHEARHIVYRTAVELVRLAFEGKTEIPPSEAAADFLRRWNPPQSRMPAWKFEEFIQNLDKTFEKNKDRLLKFREREILSFNFDNEDEVEEIKGLFAEFEKVIKEPAGVSKVLHILAPKFFPLWDKYIAKAYNPTTYVKPRLFTKTGVSSETAYINFMYQVAHQLKQLEKVPEMALKRLDEYNYLRYTKGTMTNP